MSAMRSPSPLATGGAGFSFEHRVAAIVMAALLRGDRIPGLDSPVSKVGLQQRPAGRHLDDIVAHADQRDGPTVSIDYQVKRTLQLGPSSAEWRSVVAQCVATVRDDPDGVMKGHHRLGVAAAGPMGTLRALRDLTDIARNQDTIADLETSVASARGAVRTQWAALRETVRQVTAASGGDADEMAFRIATAMQAWIVEADENGREIGNTLDRLDDLLPSSAAHSAKDLFAHLCEIAQARSMHAGTITTASLRAVLEQRGVLLTADQRTRAALEAFTGFAARVLADAHDRIANRLHLPRAALIEQVKDAVSTREAVLLTGPAGVGKSALARAVAQQICDAGGTVIALPLVERGWRTIGDIDTELRQRFDDAVLAAATTGPRLLLIDGAEQILTDAGTLLRGILSVIPTDPDQGPPWRIVLTVREGPAGTAVLDQLKGLTSAAAVVLTIPELTDDEVAEILEAFPRLRPLARDARPRQFLLRRPKLIDLLVRSSAAADLPPTILAEEDVADVVFERLVRRDDGAQPGQGNPEARARAFLLAGETTLAGQIPAPLTEADPEAVTGLVVDDLLSRTRGSYRPTHDVLADYAAVCRALEPDGADRLAAAPNPRRLLRAVRLWAQHKFRALDGSYPAGGGHAAEIWSAVAAAIGQIQISDGQRWADLPYEALLGVGRADAVLRALTPVLMENDGRQLETLLHVTGRRARLNPGNEDGPLDSILSTPVVTLLAELANQTPVRLRSTAMCLIRRHLTGLADRDAVATGANDYDTLTAALLGWVTEDQPPALPDHYADGIEALGLLAEHLTTDAEEYLLSLGRRDPLAIAPVVEEPAAAQALASHRPELLFQLAELYYLSTSDAGEQPKPEPFDTDPIQLLIEHEMDPLLDPRVEGVRDHWPLRRDRTFGIGRLAGPDNGPFAALLDADPPRGLRLVGTVVDAATRARNQLGRRPQAKVSIDWPGWNQKRPFAGEPQTWLWPWRLGSGAFPAQSALMAVRRWAGGRIQAGRPVGEVISDVLCSGTSLALVGAAVSILHDLPEIRQDCDPFLAHPLLWHLDIVRAVQQSGGIAHGASGVGFAWSFEQIAMGSAVWATTETRRQQLATLSAQLKANAHELVDAGIEDAATARMLARKWAAQVDPRRHHQERIEGGLVQVTVDYPADVVEGLRESGGTYATLSLRLYELTYDAIQARDGHAGGAPIPLRQRLDALLAELQANAAGVEPADERNAVAAVASALILSHARGDHMQPRDLEWATDALLDIIETTEDFDPTGIDFTYDSLVPQSADRSAASALPALCIEPGLDIAHQRRVGDAIVNLAGSDVVEVRARLTAGLRYPIAADCVVDPRAHDVALSALREMIRSSGLGTQTPEGDYPVVPLDEPLESALRADTLAVDPELAAPALPGLIAFVARDCTHAVAAKQLLDALIEHDLVAWPTAPNLNPKRLIPWRNELDTHIAGLALNGQPQLLRRYLEAFADAPTDLTGMLQALARLAVTPQRGESMLALWPEIMEALLPDNRRPATGHGARTSGRELDMALLPMPPDGARWPVESSTQILTRWFAAYRERPQLADHFIEVVGRLGWLNSPATTGMITIVLGSDPRAIRLHSRLAVPWLTTVLRRLRPSPFSEERRQAQELLDTLASAGDSAAIQLQAQLETEGPTN